MIDSMAHDVPGVYYLARPNGEIALIEAARKMKTELLDHLAGPAGKIATKFAVTLCSDPAAELQKVLDEFQAAHQRLPELNQARP